MPIQLPFTIERVTALPVTKTPNTLYIVKSSESPNITLCATSLSGTESFSTISNTEMSAAISSVTDTKLSSVVVATKATMLSLTLNTDTLVCVSEGIDATTQLDYGPSLFIYNKVNNTFTEVSPGRQEWSQLNGKPSSSVVNIDSAVALKHAHANNDTLNKLSTGSGDILHFNNQPLTPTVVSTGNEW